MHGIRDDLRGEIHGFRDELRGEMHSMHDELVGRIDSCRDELRTDMASMHHDLAKAILDTRALTLSLHEDLVERIKRLGEDSSPGQPRRRLTTLGSQSRTGRPPSRVYGMTRSGSRLDSTNVTALASCFQLPPNRATCPI